MPTLPIDDLIALVRRELGVEDVRVLNAPAAASVVAACPWVATSELPEGRSLVALFSEAPADIEALQRRMEMICASFADRLDGTTGSARPAPLRTLHDELAALAMRAGALAAFVIDAHSPVVWGIAGVDPDIGQEKEPQDANDILPGSGGDGVPPEVANAESANDVAGDDEDLVARAVDAVRALPEIETLPRGGHISQLVSDPDFGYFARSFAAIYVLVLVFDGPIDELVVRRAVLHALPNIEQLVLSLPPFDPSPNIGGQMVVRRRARRR